ncbi:MAG: Nif11-like leader peptide family natural product precursor [Synergistaceae bacterium]|nr:Nif11-like leader peptide family natural product precursor [Synergistaceae bacterium]
MSQESAREFIHRVGSEKSMSNMLDNLKSRDELLLAARSFGYDFTTEELSLAIVRIMDLDDADLEAVTGGTEAFGYGKVLSIVNLLGIRTL